MRSLLLAIAAFCLVCIGVHAAADRLDDRIMAGVERIDAFVDGIVGAWSLTRPLADWIDSALIVKASRAIALAWECLVSLLLVAQVFHYRPLDLKALQRALGQLTPRTALRPICTFCFVLAGSVAIDRVVHGAVLVGTAGVLGSKAAGLFGSLAGLAGAGATLWALGPVALASSFVSESGTALDLLFPRTWARELAILALTLPLALFAVASLA